MTIKKVAVIGAGVMGAGIAAHIANAGIPVLLLDIVPKDAKDRNVIAAGALEKLKKSNPAAFMHPSNAKLVTIGNTEDDLKLLADVDWVIEAVVEKLDIKQALYSKIAKHRKKTTIVSSNTSTIPLESLIEGQTKSFREHFLISHFFNPPRYMRLMEIVIGKETSADAAQRVTWFADHMLGKSVVPCFDTPGFIANRIGIFWLHAGVTKAIAQNISVEEADALLGKPAGVPKTGIFGLIDLVGIDLIPHVLGSLQGALAKDDLFHKLGPTPDLLPKLIAQGLTGRKGKGGFYKLGEKKAKLTLDLSTAEYRPGVKAKSAASKVAKSKGLRALLEHDSAEGRYALSVLIPTLLYSAQLVGKIATDIEAIDRAMRLGFNWKYGPFELINKLGTAWFARQVEALGFVVPPIIALAAGRPLYRTDDGYKQFLDLSGIYRAIPRAEGVLLLEDIKLRSQPIFKNISASLWNIGDGVACLEFTSKMNSLNPFIFSIINRAVKELPARGYKALVIYNEASNFSVGANITMLLVAQYLHAWPFVSWILKRGQNTYANLKYASFPVVGAPAGMALGGGCEVLLHCHALVAHAESYIGLVEGGVGIIPGWGGCKELLGRAFKVLGRKGPMPALVKTFETIGTAKVSKSAAEARDLFFLRSDDEIVMNRDRLLAAAKTKALQMAKDFKVAEPFEYRLPGATALAAVKLALHDFALKGQATPHDVVVGQYLGRTLSGGDTDITRTLTEEDLLRLERESFVPLTKTSATRARIAHILKTGKPLRN